MICPELYSRFTVVTMDPSGRGGETRLVIQAHRLVLLR